MPRASDPTDIDIGGLSAARSVLIALDFDGVLAPLQDNPDTSQMLPGSTAAIAALSALPGTRVALVSGRDITTLRRLADPPPNAWLVGSHGAEVDLGSHADEASDAGPEGSSAAASAADSPTLTADERGMLSAIDSHIDSFEHTLPAGSGAEFRIEKKPFSRTVHTRGLDSVLADALHEHVIAAQDEHAGIRVIEGHDITELAVKKATKGDGLRELIAAGSPDAVLYLGDDVTDEDAFAELEAFSAQRTDAAASETGRPRNLSLRIKVGDAPTRATQRIADPEAVAELLGRIASDRAAQQSAN
ncbi:trehalose-phosphatase [Brevibacterium sp. ZH18]|uniref:trehalose-phosphatase n=1 Tax=Brevibacterium sp. ZH18 TaxID=2927784 RepID=UPI001F6163A2|nr:trehalose-phosphatase [Brevibacterium sp. ZH18]MCI4012312.1 hypothetical protein [Brevibacterium sp. ZH18]